jgi:hypothetical protein
MGTPDMGTPEPLIQCAMCGHRESGPPLSWMYERDPSPAGELDGGTWYCASCARANLRSVEAKLDQEWW